MDDVRLEVQTVVLAELHACIVQVQRSVLLYIWAGDPRRLHSQGFQAHRKGSRTGLSPGSESNHFVLFDVDTPDRWSLIGVLHGGRLPCLVRLRVELELLVYLDRNLDIQVRCCDPLSLLQLDIVLLRLFVGLHPKSSRYALSFLWSSVFGRVCICSSEMAIPIPSMMRSTVLAHMRGTCYLTCRSPAVRMSTGCIGTDIHDRLPGSVAMAELSDCSHLSGTIGSEDICLAAVQLCDHRLR